MATIHQLPNQPVTTQPPGGGDGMDDTRLTRLETKLETILPTLATKADISDAKYDLVKWLSAIILTVAAIGISVLLFALSRISQPQSAIPQAPIVVYPAPPQVASPPVPQSPPATKGGP